MGTADASAIVEVFQGGTSLGTTRADGSGKWTFDYAGTSLGDGVYNFTARASDVAGNASSVSDSMEVTIDTKAPTVPVLAGVTRSTDSSGNQILTITGVAEADGTVKVYLKTAVIGTVKADSKGNWKFDYKSTRFADGNYLFSGSATDVAGNTGAISSTLNLLLGKTAQNLATPKLSNADIISVDNNGTPRTVATPTFSGSAKAGTVVTIVDGNMVIGTAVADASGKWTFTSPTLAKGKHQISVFATDLSGNSGLLSNPFEIQI